MTQFYTTYHLVNGETIRGGSFPADSANDAVALVTQPWTNDGLYVTLKPSTDSAKVLFKSSIVAISIDVQPQD